MFLEPRVSLAAGSTSGTGAVVQLTSGRVQLWAVLTGSGTITGGTVVLEESDDQSYAGTWSQIASLTASGLTGGAKQVVQRVGPACFTRWRVTSAITGGGTVQGWIGG